MTVSNTTKEARFGRIPVAAIESGILNGMGRPARGVYIVLCCHADRQWTARPSVDRIAKLCGCSRRQVEYGLAELRKIGAITVLSDGRGRGCATVFRLTTGESPDGDVTPEPASEKVQASCTIVDPKTCNWPTQKVQLADTKGEEKATKMCKPVAYQQRGQILEQRKNTGLELRRDDEPSPEEAANIDAMRAVGLVINNRTKPIARKADCTPEIIAKVASTTGGDTGKLVVALEAEVLRVNKARRLRARRYPLEPKADDASAPLDPRARAATKKIAKATDAGLSRREAAEAWAAEVPRNDWLALVAELGRDASDARLANTLRRGDFAVRAFDYVHGTKTAGTSDSADEAVALNGGPAIAFNGHPVDGPQGEVESGSTTSDASSIQGTIATSDEALTVTTAAIGEV